MKALKLFSLLFAFQFMSPEVHAFTDQEQFKIEMVKPWGEFGFRALGRGKNITEMRFDCSKTSDMGMVLTVVNNYGRTSNVVLPAGQLGTDKNKCQENLAKYFASAYNKRGLASIKGQQRSVELSFFRDQNKKTLSFR